MTSTHVVGYTKADLKFYIECCATMTAAPGLGSPQPRPRAFSSSSPLTYSAATLLLIGNALESGEAISGPVMVTRVLPFFIALGTTTVLTLLIRTMWFLSVVIYRVFLRFHSIGDNKQRVCPDSAQLQLMKCGMCE